MKRTSRFFLTLVGALLAVAGVVGAMSKVNNTTTVRTSYMEASYPIYASLGELAGKSPLVIRGTVSEVRPAYRVIPEGIPLEQLPREKAERIGYLLTDVVVTVDRTLAGPAGLASRSVVVTHLGGETATDRYTMEDEPISQRGRSYVFFLEPTADGRYVIVGGPQGRYLVEDQKLAAVSDGVRKSPVGKQLHGMSAATFEKDFNRLVRSSRPETRGSEQVEPLNNPERLPVPAEKPKGPPAGQ